MGRMVDLLRNGDHRPNGDNRNDEPVILSVEPHTDIRDSDDVPFIEVGGPRPAAPVTTVAVAAEPTSGLFTVRFQPFVAGRMAGRGFGSELVAFHQPDHAISVQYRSLVAEIVTQLPGSNPRVLLFAGATEGAGTSTVLLNLAVTLAKQDGARVAVVDGHFARPTLAAKLGIAVGPGLRESLGRHTPVAWSLQETLQPNLLALPAGRSALPRDDAGIATFIEQLRSRCNWVLIDAGVWDTEAVHLADATDAVYLVARQVDSGTPTTTALQASILETTGRLRGSVLTQR
ncbi:MAG: hypothetical protein U0746_01375 [Gemmataceae bacterium]